FSNWSNGNFISVPASGKIGISWDGFTNGANMPFTFPDGTAIFKLYFTVIGDGTSIVNISAAAAPPNVEVTAGNGGNVTLNFQNGGTPTLTLGSGNPPPPPPVGFKIIANTIYIPQGERGCMPITVNDFDNMVSMQWALHWDDAVLDYECSRRFNLDGLSAGDLNLSPVQAATILLGWSDPAGQGVTRADGARIMDVCFKAIGAPGSTSSITIDGIGFAGGNGSAEAYNNSSVDVWTQANHPNGPSGLTAPIHIIVAPPAPPLDVAYSVDTIQAPPGTQGCVAVKVRNFNAVTSAEFALSYDPLELTYNNSPQFGANPLNLQASNFTHVANPGHIKFLWANASGATVANDAAIFSLCFNVIAPLGTTADIQFTSTPCPSITGIGTAKATGGVSM
ncbi:MAG: cohesin domain-containing protein, partial [Saprospiraceae bacterium]|nr:cohesin domain-containing protein [Saprospiraceae bacterium]